MLQLRIISGNQSGHTRRLADGTMSIGRSHDADMTLRDQAASRLHAEVALEDDRITIRDLGSSNGTKVNGKRIVQATELAAGDRITIADTDLILSDQRTSGPRVLCTDGSAVGRQFDLAVGRNVIGRDAGCEIQLADRSVASLHAAINRDDGSMILHDLNTREGTFLNGDRIRTPSRLRSGDVITIGTFSFEVVDPAIDDLEADFFLGFSLISRIGSGTVGTTFKARSHEQDEVVALTIFPPAVTSDAATKARLLNAIRAMSRIKHANVVPVIASGNHQDYLYVASAYAENGSLAEIIDDDDLAPSEIVIALILDAARGLRAAHEQRLLHGGLKPADILIDSAGVGMVSDFGLTAVLDREFNAGGEHPYYRAPEELDGGQPDARSDQYALGAVAYHALTGEPPFAGGDAAEVAEAHRTQRLPSILDYHSTVPKAMVALVGKLMAVDPEERYADWSALCDDLERVAEAGDAAPVTTGTIRSSSVGEATGVRRRAVHRARGRGSRVPRRREDPLRRQFRDIPPALRSGLTFVFVLIGLLFLWILLRPFLR